MFYFLNSSGRKRGGQWGEEKNQISAALRAPKIDFSFRCPPFWIFQNKVERFSKLKVFESSEVFEAGRSRMSSVFKERIQLRGFRNFRGIDDERLSILKNRGATRGRRERERERERERRRKRERDRDRDRETDCQAHQASKGRPEGTLARHTADQNTTS